jgi:hypothetical protein
MKQSEGMFVERLEPSPAKQVSLLLGVPQAFLASVCIAVLIWAFLNDKLAATPGLEWLPHIRLRMEFNSIPFMLLFVPYTFALYAAPMTTATPGRKARWARQEFSDYASLQGRSNPASIRPWPSKKEDCGEEDRLKPCSAISPSNRPAGCRLSLWTSRNLLLLTPAPIQALLCRS